MKLIAFCIYDEKVEAFKPPFFAQAVGQAVRMFGDLCGDPETPFSKHPDDYRLYRVGEFLETEGRLVPAVMPELVASGGNFKMEPELAPTCTAHPVVRA